MFAILFGLSTDYEVFLVSRMHEEWTLTGDNRRAVIRGQAETSRVITAASLIMILVFAAFILAGQMSIMQVGLGFAAAIFVDASSSAPSWCRRRCTWSVGPTGGCPRGWTGSCPGFTWSPPSPPRPGCPAS